jgi:hypothetical protein
LAEPDLAVGFTNDEKNEIEKIRKFLDPDEQVLLVATQSRINPGGSLATPNTIFATDRKIVIRNPVMLGLREEVAVIPYEGITAINAQKGLLSSEVKVAAAGLPSQFSWLAVREGFIGLPAIPKDKADKFVNIVSDGIRRAKAAEVAPPAPPTAASTPLEELKRLKELLDMGAISQGEFEEEKKKLLERI